MNGTEDQPAAGPPHLVLAGPLDDFLNSLDSNGQATAHTFRCRTCATDLACTDFG
jgi:uncharacterized protein CbrC (UPF0167 family)